MYNLGRTIRAALQPRPKIDPVIGDALVFGAAPDAVVPGDLHNFSTIVTTNASQLALEPYGIEKPDITCMRANMDDGLETSVVKLKALKGRKTGLLVLYVHRKDKECVAQRRLLEAAGYEYDALRIISRLDASTIYNRILCPGFPTIHRNFGPSMGLRAVLHCLAAGADRVALGGVSFRTSGCFLENLDYERLHIADDQEILRRIRDHGLPVFPTDAALVADTGLQQWPSVAHQST